MARVKTEFVQVGDIEIAYRIFGKGHPLVMIMGYSGTMDLWPKKVLEILSSKYKVVVLDNRGMGRTSLSDKEMSIKLFAEDTAGLLKALGIKQAHVLGWSMGTNIAQELALRYPKIVNKLVLYAADCGGKEAIKSAFDTINALIDASVFKEKKVKRVLRELFQHKWLKKNMDSRKYMPYARKRTPDINIRRQWEAIESWRGTYTRLHKITAPTLLVTGDHDMATPSANSLILAQRIPDSHFVQIKNGGHGVMYQYPKQFSRIVLYFLKSTEK